MRLLDRVVQSCSPLRVQESGTVWRLLSACDFSAGIKASPLRLVITDALLRLCVELAYSEGDELRGCLDLIHFPAPQLWIEWNDPVKQAELARVVPACTEWADSPILQKGVLLLAQAGVGGTLRSCRMHMLCTQHSDPDDALVMATEAHVDLDHRVRGGPAPGFLSGGTVVVYDPADASLNTVLQHVGFRLDPTWQRYYRSAVPADARMDVVRNCLSGVAVDIPIVLSLLLLMSLRTGLVELAMDRSHLNARRARLGRPPLLRHFEISSPALMTREPAHNDLVEPAARSGPCLHHVRGHLVRRGDSVYWRRPHWRRHLRLGSARGQGSESHYAPRSRGKPQWYEVR